MSCLKSYLSYVIQINIFGQKNCLNLTKSSSKPDTDAVLNFWSKETSPSGLNQTPQKRYFSKKWKKLAFSDTIWQCKDN